MFLGERNLSKKVYMCLLLGNRNLVCLQLWYLFIGLWGERGLCERSDFVNGTFKGKCCRYLMSWCSSKKRDIEWLVVDIFGVEQISGDSRQNLQSIDTYVKAGAEDARREIISEGYKEGGLGMPIKWARHTRTQLFEYTLSECRHSTIIIVESIFRFFLFYPDVQNLLNSYLMSTWICIYRFQTILTLK